jgi:hypothetical protein
MRLATDAGGYWLRVALFLSDSRSDDQPLPIAPTIARKLLAKPSRRPLTQAQTNRRCLQIGIRRLRRTTRFERNKRRDAQSIAVR